MRSAQTPKPAPNRPTPRIAPPLNTNPTGGKLTAIKPTNNMVVTPDAVPLVLEGYRVFAKLRLYTGDF